VGGRGASWFRAGGEAESRTGRDESAYRILSEMTKVLSRGELGRSRGRQRQPRRAGKSEISFGAGT
jgi:hypothetical protein